MASRANVGAIFMYHHVSPAVQPGAYARALTVTPAEFGQQLAWLTARGCEVVTVDRLWRDAQQDVMSRCEAALTFDDGYDDIARFAEPLLRGYSYPATLYISTGFVNASGHMSIGELRAAWASGYEIGAHTVHHVDLTEVSPASALGEISASSRSLQNWLGVPTTSFAYPAGKVDSQVAAMVARLHFVDAVTTDAGRVDASADAFHLPRYRILRGQGTSLLSAVFDHPSGVGRNATTLAHIASQRIEGNDQQTAKPIAVALLARNFPEQIVKVHVAAVPAATVVGVVVSGVKFHRAVDRRRFAADVAQMIAIAFDAAPATSEVDVWATVPMPVGAGATVSGDYATPVERTVFSAAVTRAQWERGERSNLLGITYWDPQWLGRTGLKPGNE